MMTKMNATPTRDSVLHTDAAKGLALVRVTIGAMFVWVFFEDLGKGLYTPGGYARLINYYIQHSHSPGAWKVIMGLAASHAAMAGPMQATTEISLGVLLLIGLLTRPVAFVAFLLWQRTTSNDAAPNRFVNWIPSPCKSITLFVTAASSAVRLAMSSIA